MKQKSLKQYFLKVRLFCRPTKAHNGHMKTIEISVKVTA